MGNSISKEWGNADARTSRRTPTALIAAASYRAVIDELIRS